MKNTTLAVVAVLAAAMLSAGLAVPMEQASATTVGASDGGDSGYNKVKIMQSNKCEDVEDESCTNDLTGTITQNSGEGEDGGGSPDPP